MGPVKASLTVVAVVIGFAFGDSGGSGLTRAAGVAELTGAAIGRHVACIATSFYAKTFYKSLTIRAG